ncbi:hypothetical protein BLOT_005192 [Blomia tropicalis]|nr:hypothetical protein BLOT_005192 [Blomia tropicalis]
MKLSINRKLTEHHLARLNPIELMKIDSKLTKTKRVVQCQHSTRYPMYNMTIQMIGNIDKLSSQASSFSSPKANNRYSSIWFD